MKRRTKIVSFIVAALILGSCHRPDIAGKEWRQAIEKRYDLPALEAFIVQVVERKKTFDGVDLASSKLWGRWEELGDRALNNGFWIFSTPHEDLDAFDLSYNFWPKPIITFHCRRISASQFRIISIEEEEPDEHGFTP